MGGEDRTGGTPEARRGTEKRVTKVTTSASDVAQEHVLMSEWMYIRRKGARNGTVLIRLRNSLAEKGEKKKNHDSRQLCFHFWLKSALTCMPDKRVAIVTPAISKLLLFWPRRDARRPCHCLRLPLFEPEMSGAQHADLARAAGRRSTPLTQNPRCVKSIHLRPKSTPPHPKRQTLHQQPP